MSLARDLVTIRQATSIDAAALAELGAATFAEAFGRLYPPEDLRDFLDRKHSVENWTRTLADSGRAVFLAEHGGRQAGFICVGACKLPVRDLEATAGEIQQLYVLAQFHNLRLGTRLMEQGLNWLA